MTASSALADPERLETNTNADGIAVDEEDEDDVPVAGVASLGEDPARGRGLDVVALAPFRKSLADAPPRNIL